MASGPRRKLPAQRLATFPRRPRVSSARYLRCSPSPPSSSAPAPRRYFPALADRLFVDRSRQPKQYLLGRSRQMSLKIISDSVWWEKHSSGAQSPPPPPHWYSNQRTQRQSCCCCCCCWVERGISHCVQSFGGHRVSVTVRSVCDRQAAAWLSCLARAVSAPLRSAV